MNALTFRSKLVRRIVFGRHGRIFKDPDIRLTLSNARLVQTRSGISTTHRSTIPSEKTWMYPHAEAAQHETVEPGDMALYRESLLTRRKLGTHTNAEWTVLRRD
jgi:hypothetical protein